MRTCSTTIHVYRIIASKSTMLANSVLFQDSELHKIASPLTLFAPHSTASDPVSYRPADPTEEQRSVLACAGQPAAAGSVVVRTRDGRRRLLLPDGNTAVRDAEGNTVATNQKGARVLVRADGSRAALQPLPVATQVRTPQMMDGAVPVLISSSQ